MSLNDEHKKNFDTLQKAIESNDAALLQCWDVKDKRFVAVICAVNRLDSKENGDGDCNLVPLAMLLCEDNPYFRFLPPFHPDYPEDKDVAQDISTDADSGDGTTDEPAEEAWG